MTTRKKRKKRTNEGAEPYVGVVTIDEIERRIHEHSASPDLEKLTAAKCEAGYIFCLLANLLNPSLPYDKTSNERLGVRSRKELERKVAKIRKVRAIIAQMTSDLFVAYLLHREAFRFPQLIAMLDRFCLLVSAFPEFDRNLWRDAAKANLVNYVKKTTGKFHDEEVSALIAAAAGAPCSPDALKVWRREFKGAPGHRGMQARAILKK